MLEHATKNGLYLKLNHLCVIFGDCLPVFLLPKVGLQTLNTLVHLLNSASSAVDLENPIGC